VGVEVAPELEQAAIAMEAATASAPKRRIPMVNVVPPGRGYNTGAPALNWQIEPVVRPSTVGCRSVNSGQTPLDRAGPLLNDGCRDASFNKILVGGGRLAVRRRSVATGEPGLLLQTTRPD
jgi:hypothetical protein